MRVGDSYEAMGIPSVQSLPMGGLRLSIREWRARRHAVGRLRMGR